MNEFISNSGTLINPDSVYDFKSFYRKKHKKNYLNKQA